MSVVPGYAPSQVTRSAGPARARGALGVLLPVEAVLIWISIQHTFREEWVLAFETPALVVFLFALWALARSQLPARIAARSIVVVGSVLDVIAMTRRPALSDDYYRYLWDAQVQLSGTDPYRYAPSDPRLDRLHTAYLFPQGLPCVGHRYPGGCTRMNLPLAHTIYPPVTQAMFSLLRVVSFGGHGQQIPLQLAAFLGVTVITGILLRRAQAEGRPLWTVAAWAWCPVTVLELCNNAHIDWLGVLLAVLAIRAATRATAGRKAWAVAAGLFAGAAFATKLYPALVGPSLLRRRPVTVVGCAVILVGLVYLPHVVAVGSGVVGYLPTYLNAGGFGSGHQYRLIELVLPASWATPAAALIVVAVVVWALLHTDAMHPERTALIVIGVSILVVTPPLPWYTVLLLAMVAWTGRVEWLGVVFAPTYAYLAHGNGAPLDPAITVSFGVALILLVVGTVVRRRVAAPS